MSFAKSLGKLAYNVQHKSSRLLHSSKNGLETLNEALRHLVENLPVLNPDTIEVFTYNDAVDFFIENQPQDIVVRGVVLKQRYKQEWLMIQVFLNNNDQLVHKQNNSLLGRKLVVRRFDAELVELFGSNDIILFQ